MPTFIKGVQENFALQQRMINWLGELFAAELINRVPETLKTAFHEIKNKEKQEHSTAITNFLKALDESLRFTSMGVDLTAKHVIAFYLELLSIDQNNQLTIDPLTTAKDKSLVLKLKIQFLMRLRQDELGKELISQYQKSSIVGDTKKLLDQVARVCDAVSINTDKKSGEAMVDAIEQAMITDAQEQSVTSISPAARNLTGVSLRIPPSVSSIALQAEGDHDSLSANKTHVPCQYPEPSLAPTPLSSPSRSPDPLNTDALPLNLQIARLKEEWSEQVLKAALDPNADDFAIADNGNAITVDTDRDTKRLTVETLNGSQLSQYSSLDATKSTQVQVRVKGKLTSEQKITKAASMATVAFFSDKSDAFFKGAQAPAFTVSVPVSKRRGNRDNEEFIKKLQGFIENYIVVKRARLNIEANKGSAIIERSTKLLPSSSIEGVLGSTHKVMGLSNNHALDRSMPISQLTNNNNTGGNRPNT